MASSRSDTKRRTLPECISDEQLRDGNLIADTVEDRCHNPPVFFVVVQKQGSPEVLFLGQYRSGSDAIDTARHFMADYLKRQQTACAPQIAASHLRP